MQTIITTESGSVYTLQHGFWRKNNGSFNKTWRKFCISNETIESAKTWQDIYDAEPLPLQVGLRMYITSRDEYWLSTPIVSIEETDEEQ